MIFVEKRCVMGMSRRRRGREMDEQAREVGANEHFASIGVSYSFSALSAYQLILLVS